MLIDADEERIHQLFNNLLENSCRYTDSGGKIRVTLVHSENRSIIDFDDSPPAVPDGQLEKLFQRFFRVDGSRNRATGGAGLGLALCREIVLAHGGTVEADHSPLGGLRIRVALPLRSNQES
jgi:two-component system sensor histidine kinase BaeS